MNTSYIPLYRKYRPDSFCDLVGQETISKTLSNAIETNRIAHAYLFSGPRGTGKTSTARIFAKALNCKEGPTVNPCGKCANCVDMASGFSMDVIEIDAASNRKVEDARNLLEKVQFVAVNGKYKVYIIDEVHMLTKEAFNTLLKTLEEPPKNLIFILATTEPHKVLDTIISRCQRFDFRRIKIEDIFKRLKEIAEIEKIKIDDEALYLIARKSGGGLRDALALLDQSSILALEGKKVTAKDVRLLLGSISEEELHKIADIIASKNAQNLIPLLNQLIQSGNEPLQIIRELISYGRNLLLAKTASNIEQLELLLELPKDFCNALKLQSEKFETIEIALIIEKLSEHETNMRTSSNQHLWLEVSLIGICYREEINTIKELHSRIAKLEEMVLNPNKPDTVNYQKTIKQPEKSEVITISPVIQDEKPQPQKIQPPVKKIDYESNIESGVNTSLNENRNEVHKEPEKVEEIVKTASWNALLENIESIPSRMMLHSLAKAVEISSEKIIITFNVESFVKQAQEKSKLQAIEKAAEKLFGNIPMVIIRKALPVDEKQHKELIKQETTAKPSKKEIVEQISSESLIEKQNISHAKAAEKEIIDYSEELEEVKNNVLSVTLTDQSKNVLELFNGKIIE
ncbi:MAG: DNA polymerase III subunit gamma/tau [Candidatus Gastranaerophilaceae bacterium]|jgi:DNA polymerase-3 subunit gamma/tau